MVETFGIAAIAIAVQTAAPIGLHVLPTGYDPRTDAVSDYGIGEYRGWFWAQGLAGAVGCFALAVALGDAKPSTPTEAIVLLVIAGLARLLIPIFPTDENGSRFQTARGTIHMILAIVIFAASSSPRRNWARRSKTGRRGTASRAGSQPSSGR
jgi:hypothetical membrane protein